MENKHLFIYLYLSETTTDYHIASLHLKPWQITKWNAFILNHDINILYEMPLSETITDFNMRSQHITIWNALI